MGKLKQESALYDVKAGKKATNLSINADLLRLAREQDINLSQALEETLARALIEKRRSQWYENNKAAIEEYNRYVEEHGVLGDGLRMF